MDTQPAPTSVIETRTTTTGTQVGDPHTATEVVATTVAPPKPGWRTTEFYYYGAPIVLGMLLASGVFADGSLGARAIGAALQILAAFGYGMGRNAVKTAAIRPIL